MQTGSFYLKLLAIIFLIIFSADNSSGKISLSDEEEKFIENHPVIKVANEIDWPPFDFAVKGEPRGYSIDIIRLIGKKTGLKFRFINGFRWAKLVEMGRNKQIDVFPAMWITEERKKFFNFSSPYIDTPFILVGNSFDNSINGIHSLRGKILTGIKGFASTNIVKANFPEISVIEVDSAAEGLRMVSYKKASAYLGSMAETNFAIKKHLVPNLKIIGETNLGGLIETPFLYIGIRKDWVQLAGIIEKGMDSISSGEKMNLQTKWIGLQEITRENIFNEEELKYILKHKTLTTAFADDMPPIEFLSEDGDMNGIAADYINHIKNISGLKIDKHASSSRLKSISELKDGKIDFLSAISRTKNRRKWMIFTEPYQIFPVVIVTREDAPYIGSIEFLSGKVIAAFEGHATNEFLSDNHPDLKLLKTPSVKQGLIAVVNKEAFAFVGNLATISHVIARDSINGLKVSGETNYKVEISMAVKKQNTVLRDILQKSIALSEEEKNEINRKWAKLTFEYRMDFSVLWKIGVAVLLIFVIILYWNSRLRTMAHEIGIARDEAESANRAKSVFLANMSHELRTPLNSILGFSDLMASDDSLTTEQIENIKIVRSSGEHLLGLLNDILDIAKIESGKISLEETVFDLRNMINGVKDIVLNMAQNKNLYLKLNIADSVPFFIKADKARLRQILLNLTVNAIKFTSKGGVTLEVNNEFYNDEGSTIIEFSVKDTGRGIENDFRHLIFEPFMQTQEGHKKNDGAGLGLSICRTLVNKMGGEIYLKSSPGKGSRFWFQIKVDIISGDNVNKTKGNYTTELEMAGSEDYSKNIKALDSVPEELRDALKEAVFSFDYEVTVSTIEAIGVIDKPLADILNKMAVNYKFGYLQKLFKG